MSYRTFFSASLSLEILSLGLLLGAAAVSAEDAKANTHDGKVVSMIDDQLVMTNKEGKEHTHTVAADAKLTLDGKACKAADLKLGLKIRVTCTGADQKVATRIEAIDKNADFARS